MAQRKIIDGWIVEKGDDGQVRTIGRADAATGPAAQAAPANPIRVQGAQADIARTQAQTASDVASLPYTAPKAAAEVTGQQISNAEKSGTLAPTITKAEADALKAQNEANEIDTKGRIDALVGQLNTVQDLFNKGPGSTQGVAGLRDYVPGQEASAFDSAASTLEDIAIGAFKVPGMGSTSDADAARMAKAIRPNRWAFDAGNQQQLADTRRRVDAWYETRGLPTPQWTVPTPSPQEQAAQGVSDGQGLTGSVTDDGLSTPGTWGDSLASQSLSGYNEGLGLLAGLPVDATTGLINLVPRGINAIANTNIPLIENPILGSEWINRQQQDIGSVGAPSADPANQFVRRVGNSVGASSIPVGATANTGRQVIAGLMSGLGGGTAAATAQQAFPGNASAEMIAELLGSVAGGAPSVMSARRSAQSAAEAAVPSGQQLRNQAGNLYRQAENRGVVAGPNVTGDLSQRIDTIARNEELITPTGRVSPDYPRAAEARQLLQDYAGQDMNPRQIQVVRDTLADAVQATMGKERRIARMMLNEFDDVTGPLAPELSQARDVASRYLQANEVQRAIDLAEPRAAQFSASGPENALRTEFRNLDRQMIRDDARFNPAVAEAINNVSRGTPYTNTMRNIGKLAPTGVVSAGLGASVPFGIGNAIGGPIVGTAASGATMGAGIAGRYLATKAVEDQARIAELLARNGGALNVAPVTDDIATILAGNLGQSSQYIER